MELVEKAEILLDIQDYDSAKASLQRGDDELIPSEIVHAILDGENAVKTWREFRKMSQQELAEKAGISIPYLSQIETNKRTGSIEVLSAIAKTLKVSLENIVPAQP
ncbi:MAG: helix-turn-helix transcriptional regulator [Anaerolineales bacterium]|nr:helix-turn-helix transcriptional regulator [Anaerolineales bacterium]MDX9935772.1 helix-turn-helix transcriptional regulator [Anaerolineales bacterium]GER79690.1 transcriptional regulator XRE family [Candidatus Denitrolinea symbiosum]HPP63263.1 helix-turn-helix transcriptional regulator [Anaerolineales bacterium]